MMYKIEVRKRNGKASAYRVWYGGWFPITPKVGVDVRAGGLH